jgi:hypothetical protein
VAFGDEAAEDVFDRYHTSDYVVVSDGLPLDRQRMIDHAGPGPQARAIGGGRSMTRSWSETGSRPAS